MTHKNNDLAPRVKAAISGLKNGLPKGTKSLKVGDKTYSVPHLMNVFAAYDALVTAADGAHREWSDRVRARDQADPPMRELLADFKAALVHLLGRRSSALLAFGIQPEKAKHRLTGEERAVANARLRATRKERHTLGRKQKAALPPADVTKVAIEAPDSKPQT